MTRHDARPFSSQDAAGCLAAVVAAMALLPVGIALVAGALLFAAIAVALAITARPLLTDRAIR